MNNLSNFLAHLKQTFRIGRNLILLREEVIRFRNEVAASNRDVMDTLRRIDGRNEGGVTQYNLTDSKSPELRRRALTLLSLLAPSDVAPYLSYVRMGRNWDGGYVMLDFKIDNSIAYSIGISNDVSWDLDMASRGVQVFQYDHTIPNLPQDHPNFHWRKIGVGERSAETPDLRSIRELIEGNGHQLETNLVLKMDVEGAEWSAILETPSEILGQFSQIVVEFHTLDRIEHLPFCDMVLNCMRHLNKTHQSVHLHANNYGKCVMMGGVLVPEALEVTFVRRTDHKFTTCSKVFPTELDMPCEPNRDDIHLGAMGAYWKQLNG